MKEIKLVIDDKEIQLTNEQLKMLGIEVRKSPFERVNRGQNYFYIDMVGGIANCKDIGGSFDNEIYSEANYFNDEEFANRVALRQLLDRKLLKYAYDNGYEGTEESGLYYVNYCPQAKSYTVQVDVGFRAFCTHFSSYEATERAIKEVVEPFVKEHAEFTW